MNTKTLSVLLVVILSACSPKQNTDFIVDDYLENIQVLDENNEFLKEKITEKVDVSPSRYKAFKEDVEFSCSLFSSSFKEIKPYFEDPDFKLSKNDFNRIYDESIETVKSIEKLFERNDYNNYGAIRTTRIFDEIKSKTFWKDFIKHSNSHTLKLNFAKHMYELKVVENSLLKLYDDIIDRPITCNWGVAARVISSSDYIKSGSFFEAEIHLVHQPIYNSMRVFVNDKQIPTKSSFGKYCVKAPNYPAIHTVNGYIEIDAPEGTMTLPFQTEWQSFVPAVSFEFDEYQKIKSGEETEFTVNIPGFRQEDVIVETSKGKVTKQKGIGKFKILVDEKPNTQFLIKVSVIMPDGSIRKMGERKMVVE